MSTALSLMKNGKSNGLDGTPFEWYKKFWNIIGHDLHDVFLYSIKTGKLPTSCRQGVVMCHVLSCDIIFFTKCLSLRLKRVLPDIIHADQTCGIPGRHIYDSIALSRDIIDYAKGDDIPMSIINIDQ